MLVERGEVHVPAGDDFRFSGGRCTRSHIHPVFAMLSYNGQINIALVADNEAIPDVHVLPIFYMRALVALGNEFKVGIPACVEAASEQAIGQREVSV